MEQVNNELFVLTFFACHWSISKAIFLFHEWIAPSTRLNENWLHNHPRSLLLMQRHYCSTGIPCSTLRICKDDIRSTSIVNLLLLHRPPPPSPYKLFFATWAHILSPNMDVWNQEKRSNTKKFFIFICANVYKNALISVLVLLNSRGLKSSFS